jgi:hypothetical protein
MIATAQLVASAIGLAGVVLVLLWRKPANRYPPGPKGLPVIGNLLDIPKEQPWVAYREWSHRYSTYGLWRVCAMSVLSLCRFGHSTPEAFSDPHSRAQQRSSYEGII